MSFIDEITHSPTPNRVPPIRSNSAELAMKDTVKAASAVIMDIQYNHNNIDIDTVQNNHNNIHTSYPVMKTIGMSSAARRIKSPNNNHNNNNNITNINTTKINNQNNN